MENGQVFHATDKEMRMTRQRIKEACLFIKSVTDFKPEIAVVLGSGLGEFADTVEYDTIIDYSDIPGFPVSTTPGHKGRLIFGNHCGRDIAVMQGRFHCYEGYAPDETVIPLRALIKLGVKTLLITNASGGINEDFSAGDIVIITDHINFTQKNPLSGPNIGELGPRFPDMTFAYDKGLIKTLEKAAQKSNIEIKKGIYTYMAGPSFETPAEIRALKILGADMAGMSTVPEIIAAAHAGVKSCAISCVTNKAAGILNKPLSHEEVLEAGLKAKDRIKTLIDGFIKELKQQDA